MPRHDAHVLLMLTKSISLKAIIEVAVLNTYATLEQAKAGLQYEYDIDMAENANPDDPTTHPVWLNDDHTELRCSPGCNTDHETIVTIDSGAYYHDKDEPCIKYELTENSGPTIDNRHEFQLHDSLCFNCSDEAGNLRIVRGDLIAMSTGHDNTVTIGKLQHLIDEETGETFIPKGAELADTPITMSVPFKDLYFTPEAAIAARMHESEADHA